MYNQTEVMTIESLYKQRSIAAVIDNNSKDVTTHGKLLNSDTTNYYNKANNDYLKKDVNDSLIGCCEDFFKYCCICTVRKRKSVASISPATNSIKYVIENDCKTLTVPIIKFDRTVQRDVVE